jgi:GNAT superfamily N-acetyltransferase
VATRPATAADAEAICALFLASRAAALPFLPRLHTDAETLAWLREVVLAKQRVFVAVGPGETILGFAALEGVWLEHLYLRPDQRRRGIGTLLLDAVRQASPDELWLRAFQRNAEARAFYERHGFRVVARGDGATNEEREPDVTYRWTGGEPHRT